MRRLISSLVTLLVAATAVPAAAQAPATSYFSTTTNANLAHACQTSTTISSQCGLYVLGVFDALTLDRQVCASSTVNLSDTVVAVASKAIRLRAGDTSAPPVVIIRQALQQAFACR